MNKPNYVAKHDKLVRLLNITIEEATREYACASMPITDFNVNGMGVAHGGAIFALADVAFGAAANADQETGVVSLNAAIEFLRPGMASPLRAEARLVRYGAHIHSYNVEVRDAEDRLIARCMSTGFQTDVPLPH